MGNGEGKTTKGTAMSTAFTDTFIRNIKDLGRYTDAATQGLNLQVKPSGGKYWTFRYLFQGKRGEKTEDFNYVIKWQISRKSTTTSFPFN